MVDLHGFIDKKKSRAYHGARISSTFPVAPEGNFSEFKIIFLRCIRMNPNKEIKRERQGVVLEKIIGIFDEQSAFAERFKRYINERKDVGCFAVSFREEQELTDFCEQKKLTCLVLGGSRAAHPERLSIPYGVRLWVLSEEEPEIEEAEGYGILFRYQRAGELLRRMLLSEMARQELQSELITVFSPESAGMSAAYADKLLAGFAGKGKTLFLPWDPFGGCGRGSEGIGAGASISELLYLMRKDRMLAKQLFEGLPKKNGADYFCGPDYCTDLWQYSEEEMCRLIACCREYGGYRQVVFLAGAFHEGVVSVMDQSGTIYLVCSDTETGEQRKQEFYRQMKYAGQQGILSRVTEVSPEGEVAL